MEQECHVRHQEISVELEGDLVRILGTQLACRLSLADELRGQVHPPELELGNAFPDGTWMGVELGSCGREEAPAWKDTTLDVREEPLAQQLDLRERRLRLVGRRDHVRREDLARDFDRRKLELLLRAEVGVQAALAHPDVLSEAPDGETLEAFGRRELRSGLGSPRLPVLPSTASVNIASISDSNWSAGADLAEEAGLVGADEDRCRARGSGLLGFRGPAWGPVG